MVITYPDYQNSILNVSNSILKHYQVDVVYDTLEELDVILNKNYKHIFLVLLDGFGVNLLFKYLDADARLRRDFKKEITSVFPPTTVAATNAVLSGLPPYASGYIGWTQYFKNEDSNTIIFYNQDFYDSDKLLSENMAEKYLYYESIYEKIRKASPSVETFEIFPAFRPEGFASFEEQVDRMIAISKQSNRTFAYTYWLEPDATEHMKGVYVSETKAVVQNLNHSYERLVSSLEKDSLVILIADHGLVDVEEIDIIADVELMDCLVRKPSIEPRACNFFVREEKKEEFRSLFFRKYSDKFLLFSKEQLYGEQLLGTGVKHPLLDDFLGDFLAISVSKYLFNMLGEPGFKGHHAGLTKDEMLVPLIIHEVN
ncbi:MAG TPA: alkaline phosphatase family protein [Acholeplasmataceae bacterium]|nr:alkaline phosphatase family protein [Acholeplasmataceae bacterium]